jgi:hypothetical protein
VHDSPNKTAQISANNEQAKSAEVADQVLAQRRDGFENKLRPASRAGLA